MENFSVLRAIELPGGQKKTYGISIAIRSLHEGCLLVEGVCHNKRRIEEGFGRLCLQISIVQAFYFQFFKDLEIE